MSTTTTVAKGGEWLLGGGSGEVFTPEQLSEEHRMIARTTREFVEGEVLPMLDRLEQKDWALARDLVRRCGELGLLGVNVPEQYGGVELDKVSSLLVSEYVARSASFGATFGAQANLCVIPILTFGTEGQKERYLPKLVSGEWVGAYALSESGSGSDALGARARASRQADGSFILSGEKMWITNGGFADVIIVFAKVDGEHFSAFIVERSYPGVASGKEEHKMGLHGSSTTPILLQDVHVPASSLLGEIGKGHKVAFNVLNFGRFKLGGMCLGGCRTAVGAAAKYAAGRQQFGQPIASFGAIRHKLGEMIARTYALEALMYRTAGLIDAQVDHLRASRPVGPAVEPAGGVHPLLAALEEFAVEASIAKVFGSEVLGYVLDENVQVHGGNGYVRDYEAERHYRDARVNRIFEGTNEINRLLIPGLLIKRALKGDLPLLAGAARLRDEIMSAQPLDDAANEEALSLERKAVDAFRKVVLLVAGAAMERYGQKLQDEQEVLLWLADVVIDTFAADSAVERAQRAARQGHPAAGFHADATRVFVQGAALRIDAAAREALAAMSAGDTLRTQHAALRRLLKVAPVNTVSLRRRLADASVEMGAYPFA